MQTRNALRALGGAQHHIGEGPLAGLAERLVERMEAAEAARLDDAWRRAELQGAGPHLAALQRRTRELAASSLHNNAAPAILTASLHALLREAAEADPEDRGIARAATHAYRLWHKDPSGIMTVGDVARLRTAYTREFPKSRIASVIDREVPRRGFNTLPVRQLTAVAAAVMREVDRGAEPQAAYEATIAAYGLDGRDAKAFEARAFVRGLLGQADETPHMLTNDDPLLRQVAQLELEMPPEDVEPEPEGGEAAPGAGSVSVETTSPITGDPLVLELETPEEHADEPEESAPLPDGMEIMGQLDEFAPEPQAPDGLPGADMGPEPSETTELVTDPSDPNGGQLEITIKPAPDAGGAADGDMPMVAFNVYAFAGGKRGAQPVDSFRAAGMAAALKRIAGFGVRGAVLSTPKAFAREALIMLDAVRGEYLQVAVADATATPAPVAAPAAPAVLTREAARERTQAAFGLSRQQVEASLLDGNTVTAAGWTLAVNDDADIELRYNGGHARTASLAHLDEMVDNFIMHTAMAAPAPAAPAPAAPAAPAYYGVVERFALRCAGCGATNLYAMPDEAADLGCSGCDASLSANRVAAAFASGAAQAAGFFVVADVPEGSDPRDRSITARRILAAVQRVLPTATGLLRRDAKLQLDLGAADDAALARVVRILEDQYGLKAFELQAQVAPTTPPMPAPAPETPAAAPAPAPQPPQGAAPAYVGPPAVQSPAPPVSAGTPAKPASYMVAWRASDGSTGESPVEALDARGAVRVFARFNNDVEVTAVREAQLAGPPMPAPGPAGPPPAAPMPGAPMGGGEGAPMPVEDQLGGGIPTANDEPAMLGGAGLTPDEKEAVWAALKSWRDQGLGPMSALDKLNSKYKELIERYGEETDINRHAIEAEAMAIAAEVWMRPAVLTSAAARQAAGMDPGKINTQQPGRGSADKTLGKDTSQNPGPADPSINQSVVPGGKKSDTGTEPDSDNKDPGSFGAPKPQAQPDQQKQRGESFSDTNLGKDSEGAQFKTPKAEGGGGGAGMPGKMKLPSVNQSVPPSGPMSPTNLK